MNFKSSASKSGVSPKEESPGKMFRKSLGFCFKPLCGHATAHICRKASSCAVMLLCACAGNPAVTQACHCGQVQESQQPDFNAIMYAKLKSQQLQMRHALEGNFVEESNLRSPGCHLVPTFKLSAFLSFTSECRFGIRQSAKGLPCKQVGLSPISRFHVKETSCDGMCVLSPHQGSRTGRSLGLTDQPV